MVAMSYSQYYALGTAAYKYVKQAMHKGAGNRIMAEPGSFQPGFILDRWSCKNDLRKVTGPIQKKMDDDLARRMVDHAEKTWGKDEKGRWRAERGTLDLYSRTEIAKSMGDVIELNARSALEYA
jgi:hypothetical protein